MAVDNNLLAQYRKRIQEATSKEDLHKISYDALIQDENATVMDIAGGKRCLYNKVVKLCVRREYELEGYTKAQIDQMEREAKAWGM